MKLILSVLLIAASGLAYPVAESEPKVPDVPLVITDYSSVAKAESQVAHDAPHGAEGHVHDSAESSSSESSEHKSVETEKPKEENKSVDSSEEGVLQDGIPASTLQPLVEKIEEKPEVPKLQQTTLLPETPKENSEQLLKAEPLKELKEEKTEAIIPAVKSLPVEESVAKTEEKGESVAASEPVPSVRSGEILATPVEKKSEEPAPVEVEKPLALPTLKYELPAESVKSDVAQPSEQKVEASPVAEESVPQLKSTENLEIPAAEKIIEKKEARAEGEKLEEIKPVDKVQEIKLDDKKPEEKKLEEIKVEKIEEVKPAEIPAIRSGEVLNIKPEEKKSEELTPLVPIPATEEKKIEKKSIPEAPKEPIVPELKSIEPKVEVAEEKPKLEELPKAEEPKVVSKSLIEDSKPEEKKAEEVTAEKLPAPSAASS